MTMLSSAPEPAAGPASEPAALPPRRPFTAEEARTLGISKFRLARMVAEGEVRRVVRGVYVAADVPDTPENRARAVALVVSPHHVVCDRTAAWLWGIDVFTYGEHDLLPPVETSALRGHEPTHRAGVRGRSRDLAPEDVVEVEGLRVTTPFRTALDLGCLLERRDALGALDAFARAHGFTARQYVDGARRYRRRRGVVQLRALAPLADPRAESMRESWTRLAIADAGLPAPEPQVWVERDGAPRYRLDLAYPRARVAVEYNGHEDHERTLEQRLADEARWEWLKAQGWTVIVVRRGDFTGDALDRWLTELRQALAAAYSNLRRLERGARRPD